MTDIITSGDKLTFSHDSWIRAVTYNTTTKQMLVITEKSSYECQGVPQTVFEEFAQSESKGSYFNRNIKGKYSHEYF